MKLTAARLRTLAETVRMIVGADDVEIGPGDERRVPVTLYFNREGGDAHGDPHADGPGPAGRGPSVVVKEITTNELAADGLGGRGGVAPGETELARPPYKGMMALRYEEAVAVSARVDACDKVGRETLGLPPRGEEPARYRTYRIVQMGYDGPRELDDAKITDLCCGPLWPYGIVICALPDPIAQHAAYIAHDFEQKPWSELGRQWPHPESYLDKLRLFRSRENDGDRQVIVTVCLAADQPTTEGETDMTDKKTWRRACTCRNGATPESPGLNLGADGVPVCRVCGKPWTLVPKPEKS